MGILAVKNSDTTTADTGAEPVNILVVDDLPEKIMVYETILEELGQNIVTARSGEEALRLVLKQEFAVILLDVNMPAMDGFETAELIRKRKKSAHTPIIFLTAFTDEVKIAQGYASGAVDYLSTPVVPEILKAKVKVFIELFQMRQQAALQAEERARRLAAEEADRCKDQFLAMLAHELRNPLGPILNGVHLLQLIAPKDERLTELRDMIDRQVTHMVRLIDDLLDSTRLAQGKILLRKERCNLVSIINQTANDYRSVFGESGIDLVVETLPDPLWTEGDPTRLMQTIGNLLHNAHKFTDPGGRVTVRLEHNARDETAQITVQDTGIGIDPAVLPYIFDVFRQADQGLDRNRGGLGLGLSLVRGLVELHDGKVTAHSDGLGKGAIFTLHVPVRAVSFLVSSDPEEDSRSAAEKYRILIIEDNQDAARSLQTLLNMEGHETRLAYTGSDGLIAAADFDPDVILCDIGLPGMDGYQFARALRSNPAFKSVYAIAMTGYGREVDVRLAREAGFNLHLTKPLDHNRLRSALACISVNENNERARCA